HTLTGGAPMPPQRIVTIPSSDPALRRQTEQGVEAYAGVRQSPSYTDPQTVERVLEIVGQGVTIAGGVAGILTFIRSLKQDQKQQDQTTDTISEAGAGRRCRPAC